MNTYVVIQTFGFWIDLIGNTFLAAAKGMNVGYSHHQAEQSEEIATHYYNSYLDRKA